MEKGMISHHLVLLLLVSTLVQSFSGAKSQSFIGVNYGQVADNLPPPEATAKLLRTTTISKVRLYGADPAMIRALAGTNISIVIGASNGDIPSLASDPSAAARWAAANVLPFVPASTISTVSIGNEVLSAADPSLAAQLLPAMQNLHAALSSTGIKISTVNTMAVLAQSDPPSTGAFHSDLLPGIKGILGFLNKTGSPFMINPYPWFAYQSDPRPETLAFCLFQQNQGRFDSGSKITYMNMFDAQVDAVQSALKAAGFPATEIVVAETGWPYRGDPNENGATVENARAFNGGLISHLRSMAGTPLMPGKSIETYIFALYDEDLKPGPTSERSFGLYRPDLSMAYDVGLAMSSGSSSPPSSSSPSSSKAAKKGWCVPKDGTAPDELQVNLDYACSQPGVDCGPIQAGGACYEPNTVQCHAAFAMNALYQSSGKNPWNCDFRQTAALSSDNPSYNGCVYQGS